MIPLDYYPTIKQILSELLIPIYPIDCQIDIPNAEMSSIVGMIIYYKPNDY